MLRALVLIGFVGASAGCGLAQHIQNHQDQAEAKQQHAAELAECDRLYPDLSRKPALPGVRCFHEANMKLASRGHPNVDLVEAWGTQMLALAEQYDAGRLTQIQFEAARATASSDYKTRLGQRQTSAALVDSARRQAGPRTCNAIGNSITCY